MTSEERRNAYERKREELNVICTRCRKLNSYSPPSIERCDECTTGRKLRMLEAEYADVTGCSHRNWGKNLTF